MSTPVKLYVYDLSNGMAQQLSRQLTGRQIDGIWHSSVVVYGKEVFYGQGINVTPPGRSHHGAPFQIVDMGETSIDEETFNEYLDEMKGHYTGDKYHLLDFNCNSFTNDCVGFLTGGEIPAYIRDLPTDFLSTPFGASLRPTIDAMYRRPSPSAATPPLPTPTSTPRPPQTAQNPELAAQILQAIASQAQSSTSSPSANGISSPLHICTNAASFRSIVQGHRAVVACFTDPATCPPCRMIEPVFERMAGEKGVRVGTGRNEKGAVFVKIDMGTAPGKVLASEWSVRVMPTFIFFADGSKIHEMKGADSSELNTQVDLLLFQLWPPHPHASLALRHVPSISLTPILFTQVPALATVAAKLDSLITAAAPASTTPPTEVSQASTVLKSQVLPYLTVRFPQPPTATKTSPTPASSALLESWTRATHTLTQILPPDSLFPLIDLWRLAFLEPSVGAWTAARITAGASNTDPISIFLNAIHGKEAPRSTMLTILRLLSNALSTQSLGVTLVTGKIKEAVRAVLVKGLLSADTALRGAAAGLGVGIGATVQRVRREGGGAGEGYEEWEVEIVSAVVEALGNETGEDTVHRLTATLGLLLWNSPFSESVQPLLEVLEARKVLRSKLVKGGAVVKPEIRKLVEEVAGSLCP
ncbi:PPPDE putative peptidase domain-containing protein [Infundibulicybe gibba]|nr:PPPDE putative peptidase domain-containing protein [Infundibulicybe gibba]